MIYTVTLNPALDKTAEIENFRPDSVNRIRALRTDPGGKGVNVSKVIAKLGGTSVAAAILGGGSGRLIADALAQLGIAGMFRFVPGETRTNLKIIDPVQHTHTDINEPGIPADAGVLAGLLAELTGRLAPGDLVVLSGSLPAGAPADTYRVWVRACRQAGASVFLDADGELLAQGILAGPDLIKPNRDELSALVGRELGTLPEIAAAARSLLLRGVGRVVVSLGGDGALFAGPERTVYAEGLRVPVGSTVGAGDSVVAALAFARERGLSPEDTVRLAMATGAANVMCSGTQAAEYAAVEALLDRVRFHTLDS